MSGEIAGLVSELPAESMERHHVSGAQNVAGSRKRLVEALGDVRHGRLSLGLPDGTLLDFKGAELGVEARLVLRQAYAPFLGPSPAENEAHAPPPGLTKMFAYVKADAPQAEVTYVTTEHPFEKGGKTALNAKSAGRISRGENYIFDANSTYTRASKSILKAHGTPIPLGKTIQMPCSSN